MFKKKMKEKKVEVLKEFQIEELERRVELSCGLTMPTTNKFFGLFR